MIEAEEKYRQELRAMTDEDLISVLTSHEPRPFESRYNQAAVELDEILRRGLTDRLRETEDIIRLNNEGKEAL